MTRHIGMETIIKAGGVSYTLGRYTRRLAHELAEWVAVQIGDPLAALEGRLNGFPPEVAASAIDYASLQIAHSQAIYSPIFQTVWQSLPGRVFELGLLLRCHHPTASPEDIYRDACLEHGSDYIPSAVIRCIGVMPQPAYSHELELGLLREWGYLKKPKTRAIKPKEKPPVLWDWLAIDKALLKGFNLTPSALDDLTLTEIFVLVESLRAEAEAINQDLKKDDSLDFKEAMTIAQAQKRLTPAQRLTLARAQSRL